MDTSALLDKPTARPPAAPTVDVVLPVYNEQADLAATVTRLRDHLRAQPFTFRITIADNASTDATPAIAAALEARFVDVRSVRLGEKGRGRALRHVWLRSDAEVLAYMDVDLSTDLDAFLPLVAPLISGHSHVAIGSRLAAGARVVRGAKREFISRSYNLILRRTLAAGFSDAQCGFKAIRRDAALELLPHVKDEGWFFDTELLVLAERAGLRIHEVPVDWIDDPTSTVDIVATALADLRGVARLGRSLATGRIPFATIRSHLRVEARSGFASQVARFVMIGLASTLAFVGVYSALRVVAPAQLANLIALVTTAVANTAANRRFTFGVVGRNDALRHHLQGLGVVAAGLALTGGALAVLHAVAPSASHGLEVVVLIAANLATTVIRFIALRVWVFAAHRRAPEVTR